MPKRTITRPQRNDTTAHRRMATAAPGRAAKRPGIAAQREVILHAALTVLGTRAIEDTRVEDILAAANVSRQTFYRAFKNLDELFWALAARVDTFLSEGLAARLDLASGPDIWITAYIDAVFEAALAIGPAIVAIAREEKRPGSPLAGATARRQARLAAQIRDWFAATYGIHADTWQIQAVLIASHEFCMRLAETRRNGDVAAAKAALATLSAGLLLHAGIAAGALTITAADHRGRELLAHLPGGFPTASAPATANVNPNAKETP